MEIIFLNTLDQIPSKEIFVTTLSGLVNSLFKPCANLVAKAPLHMVTIDRGGGERRKLT